MEQVNWDHDYYHEAEDNDQITTQYRNEYHADTPTSRAESRLVLRYERYARSDLLRIVCP